MAIDGQPAEPFPARNGALVLAPGARVDAFVDATCQPAPPLRSCFMTARRPAPSPGSSSPGNPNSAMLRFPRRLPLPSNGLPAQLDLKSALRFDVALGGAPADWMKSGQLCEPAAPAFRAKAGRIVVLALTNRGDIPAVFHLHGHHFRLLDRLDDGWKPFWLDTLAIDPGQTQRIAFAAEYAGRWLIETVATSNT